MLRFATLISCIALSSVAAAKAPTASQIFVPSSVTAEILDAEQGYYRISGETTGSNACVAANTVVKIHVARKADGIVVLIPYIADSKAFCTREYQPVNVEFSIDVQVKDVAADNIYIANFNRKDVYKSVGEFVAEFASCFEPVMCTREFLPHICQYEGLVATGTNKCVARANVARKACLKGFNTDQSLEIEDSELSCDISVR